MPSAGRNELLPPSTCGQFLNRYYFSSFHTCLYAT